MMLSSDESDVDSDYILAEMDGLSTATTVDRLPRRARSMSPGGSEAAVLSSEDGRGDLSDSDLEMGGADDASDAGSGMVCSSEQPQ